MYIVGFVIPVPEDKKADYLQWAKISAAILRDYGCLDIVESWEDFVPDGKVTDFRRAVDAKPGERIVFSWQVWPDRETLDAVEARLQRDDRFNPSNDLPFDARRLIYGCFTPLYSSRRA